MRVLILSHHGRELPGGALLADDALAEALAALGHRAVLLAYDDLLPRWVRGTWRQLAFPWAAALAWLRRRREGWDVIEATAGDAWLLRRLAGRRRPLLSVRTHGLEHRRVELDRARRRREGRSAGPLTRLYHFRWRLWEIADDLRAADAAFLLNREDADYALERLGLPPERVHVLPNGLPDALLALPEPDPDPERRFRLLFLGAWSPIKGADLLPGIVRSLFAADPRFRLTCAGVQVPADEVLAAFAPEDRGRVRAIPRYGRAELPALLAGHGIFLFPSPAEGSSLALLEAMAGGLAPVVTRTGAAADLIEPGVNGCLVEAGDGDGFAAAVLSLAAGPDVSRALEMGRAARRSVAGQSWTERAAERVRVWKDVYCA